MLITLPDYVLDFKDNLIESGRSKSTLKQYESDLKKFFTWLETHKGDVTLHTLKSLRQADIRLYFQFLKEKKLSQATIRRLATVLSRLMIYHQCVGAHEIHKLAEAAPLRALTEDDFITEAEFEKLTHTVLSKDPEVTRASARNYLLTRNWSFITLIRTFGLTPVDIHQITMSQVNLAQEELIIETENSKLTLHLNKELMKYIRDYYFSIPEAFRPRYYSEDPLFVAFNNISYSFQYDYEKQKPKALSVRAIQETIKDEVRRANLRKISAVNLRNAAILDKLTKGYSDDRLMQHFKLTSEASLRRYKQYAKEKNT
ncbi:tyrosine-type recombinase/integrase [Bacillus sp. B1-b2]|uniref:tyrosine-type recombinase/integrase n=1 Tax=Bacillus sp. B1-b2 TaxID=2653201 RepID=UPI00126185A1|nr:site-specific integrase [Bacillus sp. B1-b2]KAB7671282.1 hypothetical protein F9279_07170 [Bacillus sp. B1-b2]